MASQKTRKTYPVNQSPLYKLTSYKRLLKVLKINDNSLTKILEIGDNNYFETRLTSGRDLQIPKPQLSGLHKRIQIFFSKIEKPTYLFSGVKGRSNVDNAKAHEKSGYAYKTDIQSFYAMTSRKRVFKCFLNYFKIAPDIAEILTRLTTFNGHLPTGSSISQSLAFFSNIKTFNNVEKLCKRNNITFTLYVDDLTFSADYNFKKFIKPKVLNIFKKSTDYTLHKHRDYDPNTPKKVTGVIVKNSKLDVPNNIRRRLHNFRIEHRSVINSGNLERQKEHFQRFIGLVSCASQISPKYQIWTDELCRERKERDIPAMN